MTARDAAFTGSVPAIYEKYLVPLIFEPYAADLARRLKALAPTRVLEVAAGTGVVTRALSAALPEAAIVATDLNQAMLDQAAAIGTRRAVDLRQADAQQLPFADGTFDAVVCQFGVMFVPDKVRAYREARRVLRPGGAFVFNVWDRLTENEFAHVVHDAVAAFFPQDPPAFLGRTPYAHFDTAVIARDLAAAGFRKPPQFETVPARSKAAAASAPALGFCQGSPLRGEIEARDPARLKDATDAAAAAVTRRFGAGPVDAKMQAIVVTVEA